MNGETVAPTQQEVKPAYKWDIFLAHPGMDSDAAKNLFNKLNPPAKVFLDKECLLPGDKWRMDIPKAQRSSLISVILVTPNTGEAFYQQEEILAAIDMAHSDPRTHRVIPVYLNSKQIKNRNDYGLKGLHSLYVPETGDFTETVNKLLKTLDAMKQLEVKKDEFVVQQQRAVVKITSQNSSSAEVFAGLVEATKLVHPTVAILLVFFVFIIVLLIASAVFLPRDVFVVLAAILGSIAALLLFFTFRLAERTLSYAPQIARGNINGG
jgi:hypothetical protein